MYQRLIDFVKMNDKPDLMPVLLDDMATSKNILAVRNLFWKKSVMIFDLDGTLYLGSRALPGARELLWKLVAEKKSFFYLTNNSSRSDEDYLKKLRLMDFPVERHQIIMSTHLLISVLKRKRWNRICLLGTPAMERMLKARGIREAVKPQVVVVGFDKTLTYKKLERAVRLVEKGIPYIVTHPDLFCPTELGPEPDCGAFGKVIELITKRVPLYVLGKPNPLMLGEIDSGRLKKADMILIGDRVTTDIEMARTAGVASILVLTGETKRKDLRSIKVGTRNILPSVKVLL